MLGFVGRYVRWLHTKWPAGHVEKLPEVREDYSTNVPGLYVVGDLTGIPLLKLSSDSGARAVQEIVRDKTGGKFAGSASSPSGPSGEPTVDVAIIGAGVSGMAAALAARKNDLSVALFEASEPFSTIVNFPKGKPIYTYPRAMTPHGDLQFSDRANVKESLLDELRQQTLGRGIEPRIARVECVKRQDGLFRLVIPDGADVFAHRVVVGIGRSGNFRKLGVPGEDKDKVYNRLHDPKDFCGQQALVVGGGDSALETAIALAQCGSDVTVSYRKPEFSRPKPDNVEMIEALRDDPSADVQVEEPSSERVTTAAGGFLDKDRRPGSIRLRMASKVREIRDDAVVLETAGGSAQTVDNDVVFTMIGREPPLEFFRRSGVRIRGEWSVRSIAALAAFFLFCVFLYSWKSSAGLGLKSVFEKHGWFPFNLLDPSNTANLLGTLAVSLRDPSFWYSLAYCVCIVLFGIKRIRRRQTPYVTTQTLTLMSIQVVPLFLLPFVLLPWMGHNGWFDAGVGKSVADALFPTTEWSEQGREYWRAFGFILAWPLMVWNLFTNEPLWAWLTIGTLQTFVLIPWMVRKWGKGAYCGWICSCGALAETLGDTQRHKMPHGPKWNRANMIGQVFLVLALVLLLARVASWVAPEGAFKYAATAVFMFGLYGKDSNWGAYPFPFTFLNYEWFVDLLWAGIFGVAFYFWFSGRVWCRFACPLAALMHIYARFGRFRIISEKKKCISCNVCTSVCHQGIDVMNFANKGVPMEDPECVRCSACVQSCPTGTLQFGEVDPKTGDVLRTDRLAASPVLMRQMSEETQ